MSSSNGINYIACLGKMRLQLKGLCRQNVNIENRRETCLQIGTYVGLIISFLDLNYTKDII